MRAVLQRVKNAKLYINDSLYSSIDKGLVVLVCVCRDDGGDDLLYMAKKIANMRIFSDEDGKFNLSVKDVQGECLVVSQFTLAADTKKGNRPSYFYAQEPKEAKIMYEKFVDEVANLGIGVKKGVFGANMQINLVNDGPVTIYIDSKDNA
jgi:D-tyrosyl-tRNA(Tyr) deacylase